jgi:hypothetical protein
MEHSSKIVRVLVAWFLIAIWSLPGQDTVYVCPMDPDIRSSAPGTCPRCGMKLRSGIPEPVEYAVDLHVKPVVPRPGDTAHMEFVVRNPWNQRPVTKFQPVHEKLFHLFVVSQDLQFFAHEHPDFHGDGKFGADLVLPGTGLYRMLADFYPDGGTPQLAVKTLILPDKTPVGPGKSQNAMTLVRDYSTKDAANLRVELTTDPPQPIAGSKTMLFFRATPAEGLEPYLGALGHMLAASDDLIDLIHEHPFLAEGGSQIQFNLIFPRARTYRLWVQFQRKGVVNTVHFDIPVSAL